MTWKCIRHPRPALPARKLFAAVAAVLGVDGTAAAAVTSCADDGGFDTLRHAVQVANDGDTIDLTALACSKITLGSAISTGLYNLGIAGPGAGLLTIDGNHVDRVFSHTPTGPGTLTISNVTVAHGSFSATKAYGGCIYSKENVVLRGAVVTSCTAVGQSVAVGGGVSALGNMRAYTSVISGNTANAQVGSSGMTSAVAGGAFAQKHMGLYGSVISGNTAEGATGKVYAGGVAAPALVAKYSTITGNHASSLGTDPNVSFGGGAEATAYLEILNSTLDHNVADVGGALLIIPYSGGGHTAAIVQTTISANTGTLGVGAMLLQGDTSVANSTIAFNSSGTLNGAAVVISGAATTAVSTIIADNSPSDIDATSPATLGGDHDLIKLAGSNVTVPPLTITLDPDLQPLANNGGYTRMHALGDGSVAIAAGSNASHWSNDQRGPPYLRVVGGMTDIGAYQVDPDHIFGSTFEFGPLVP